MIDVVVVENHRLVRQAIIALLATAVEIHIVGEGANGEDAIQLVAEQSPDVVVMNLVMPTMNGLEVLQKLGRDHPPVLIISIHNDRDLVHAALQAGAAGYVLKRMVAGELVQGIKAVKAGEQYLSEGLRGTMEQ